MLCEKCGKNTATVRAKTVVNGFMTEKSYCAACWSDESEQMAGHFSFSDLLKGFLQQSGDVPVQTISCQSCGMDFKSFRHGGLLGCPACYEAFEKELTPMLKKIHGKTLHEGKRPAGEYGPAPREMAEENKENKEKRENKKSESELDILKRKLDEAVAKEEYEKAAIYRDRIKELAKEE
ncbi:MAG: UvrB/UvrC motif-containing protein [Christensenellales bacterium]|jgi:protein arginine kinase activator